CVVHEQGDRPKTKLSQSFFYRGANRRFVARLGVQLCRDVIDCIGQCRVSTRSTLKEDERVCGEREQPEDDAEHDGVPERKSSPERQRHAPSRSVTDVSAPSIEEAPSRM